MRVVFLALCLIVYYFWRRLEKYNHVDYGHKTVNRLMGLNYLVTRKWHRLGDYWLDLPEKGGLILAANHSSGMDPAVLCAASKRPVRFLATSVYYDLPFVHRILKGAGVIPVYKNKDNKIALQKAIEALQKGEVIGIFPFGGIHAPTHEEPRMRSGVAVLSKLAGAPIYPIFIGGINPFSFNRVFTSMFFKRSRLELKQYKPIVTKVLADKANEKEEINKVMDYLHPLLSNHLNADKGLVFSGKVKVEESS